MVLGLLIIGAIPTVTGVAQAISAQKQQNAQARNRIKFHLTAQFAVDDFEEETAFIVFKDGKLYFDHPDCPLPDCYRFNGYYFGYPSEEQHQGLVSTISDDPPMLNWIFVDKDTLQLRHGSRTDSLGHIIGPWGWTEDEENLTLEEMEGFVAIEPEEEGDPWGVYYDKDGDIEQVLDLGDRRIVDINLHRELQLGVASSYTRS